MTKAEAIKFYTSQKRLADALGLTQPTISLWKAVPPMTQLELEKLTGGALKADPAVWAKVPAVDQQRGA